MKSSSIHIQIKTASPLIQAWRSYFHRLHADEEGSKDTAMLQDLIECYAQHHPEALQEVITNALE